MKKEKIVEGSLTKIKNLSVASTVVLTRCNSIATTITLVPEVPAISVDSLPIILNSINIKVTPIIEYSEITLRYWKMLGKFYNQGLLLIKTGVNPTDRPCIYPSLRMQNYLNQNFLYQVEYMYIINEKTLLFIKHIFEGKLFLYDKSSQVTITLDAQIEYLKEFILKIKNFLIDYYSKIFPHNLEAVEHVITTKFEIYITNIAQETLSNVETFCFVGTYLKYLPGVLLGSFLSFLKKNPSGSYHLHLINTAWSNPNVPLEAPIFKKNLETANEFFFELDQSFYANSFDTLSKQFANKTSSNNVINAIEHTLSIKKEATDNIILTLDNTRDASFAAIKATKFTFSDLIHITGKALHWCGDNAPIFGAGFVIIGGLIYFRQPINNWIDRVLTPTHVPVSNRFEYEQISNLQNQRSVNYIQNIPESSGQTSITTIVPENVPSISIERIPDIELLVFFGENSYLFGTAASLAVVIFTVKKLGISKLFTFFNR